MKKSKNNLTKEQVKKIAELAKLNLNKEEIKKMQGDLSDILDYFSSLEELDTEDVKPSFYSIPISSVLRKDKVDQISKQKRKKLLDQVPKKQGRLIKVKEILK